MQQVKPSTPSIVYIIEREREQELARSRRPVQVERYPPPTQLEAVRENIVKYINRLDMILVAIQRVPSGDQGAFDFEGHAV